MKFSLVDRIEELVPGRRIRTIKALTLSEEYLADHFQSFPVMPGVLMLESMAQAAAWLVRVSEDFGHSMVFLAQAKNVIYKSFVVPGQTLTVDVECKRLENDVSEFAGRGVCGRDEVVKGRLTLKHINLADRNKQWAALDRELIAHARSQYAVVNGVGAAPADSLRTGP